MIDSGVAVTVLPDGGHNMMVEALSR